MLVVKIASEARLYIAHSVPTFEQCWLHFLHGFNDPQCSRFSPHAILNKRKRLSQNRSVPAVLAMNILSLVVVWITGMNVRVAVGYGRVKRKN
jgi:hypothetical protein